MVSSNHDTSEEIRGQTLGNEEERENDTMEAKNVTTRNELAEQLEKAQKRITSLERAIDSWSQTRH
ncbi:unnamed protein product, partial [Dovyalis caffra]